MVRRAFAAPVLVASLAGCHGYVCSYKGHDYHQGETWTDGCKSCRCPAEGAKTLWCEPLACPDGGSDADARSSP